MRIDLFPVVVDKFRLIPEQPVAFTHDFQTPLYISYWTEKRTQMARICFRPSDTLHSPLGACMGEDMPTFPQSMYC